LLLFDGFVDITNIGYGSVAKWTMSFSGCGLWLVKFSQDLPHNTSDWDSFVLTRRAVLTLDKATN
jgi:hypothetical protein